MAATLLSGPAGAGKSAAARELLAELPQGVLIDFQELYAGLLGIRRDPETGRYPERLATHAFALPLAELLRQIAIARALENELDIVATNSDGDAGRRNYLLGLLGPGAIETILDPGRDVVTGRLAEHTGGVISQQCADAINRWYGRL